MEISEFTLQILLIGTPGILCYFLTSNLIGEIGKNVYEKTLFIFLCAIISYSFYSFFDFIFGLIVGGNSNKHSGFDLISDYRKIIFPDVLWATLISIILAFIISFLDLKKALNKFARIINVSYKSGDETVWCYFQNLSNTQKNDNWVHVRDSKANLVYYGNITAWSDDIGNRELILSDVTVYNNDNGEELYEVEHLYLCRSEENLTIEVPKINCKVEHGKN